MTHLYLNNAIFSAIKNSGKFELEILMFFLADIHGQQIKWRASMEVKDMVGTIRLLMIFQVSFFSIDSNNIGFQSFPIIHFPQLVAAFLFMIMVVGNKCFLKKRQTKEEEKCLQKTSYAVNITIVIFSLLAGMGFHSLS